VLAASQRRLMLTQRKRKMKRKLKTVCVCVHVCVRDTQCVLLCVKRCVYV
jgi:hypothetical protein